MPSAKEIRTQNQIPVQIRECVSNTWFKLWSLGPRSPDSSSPSWSTLRVGVTARLPSQWDLMNLQGHESQCLGPEADGAMAAVSLVWAVILTKAQDCSGQCLPCKAGLMQPPLPGPACTNWPRLPGDPYGGLMNLKNMNRNVKYMKAGFGKSIY